MDVAERIGPHDRVLVAALCSLVFVGVANTAATAVAQPAIERALDVSPAQVGALVFAYVGTFALSAVLHGRFGPRWGTTRVLAIGAVVLAVGALLAATSMTLAMLVAARMLQGVGAGAIPTLSLSILGDRFTGRRRARAIGLYITGVGAGHALGPVLGGVLVDLVSWRAAVAIGIAVVPGAWVTLRVHRAPAVVDVPLDVWGALSVSGVVGAAIWLVSQGPRRGLDGTALGALALLAVSAAGWSRSTRGHPSPFLPFALVRHPEFVRCGLVGASGMAVFLGILTGVPLVLGDGATLRGTQIGATLLPMAAAIGLTSPRNGRVVATIGRRRTGAVALGGLTVGATAATVALQTGAGAVVVAWALLPAGIGFGLLAAPLTTELATVFAPPTRSLALGAFNVAFFGGGAVGSATVATSLEVATTRVGGVTSSLGGLASVAATVAVLTLCGPGR